MRTSLLMLTTIGALLTFADNAWACSCIGMPIEQKVAQNAAVFIGEIVAVKHNQNRVPLRDDLTGPVTVDATFRVTRVVKGEYVSRSGLRHTLLRYFENTWTIARMTAS